MTTLPARSRGARKRRPDASLLPGHGHGRFWWYLVPGFAALFVIIIVPLCWNVYLSFTSYRGIKPR